MQAQHEDALERMHRQAQMASLQAGAANNAGRVSANAASLDQMRAVAEVAMREMDSKVKDSKAAYEEVKRLREADLKEFVDDQARLHEEVNRLQQQLFERKRSSIQVRPARVSGTWLLVLIM